MNLKTFKMWEMAANSVGGVGVSMPASAKYDPTPLQYGLKKKKPKIMKRTDGAAKKDDAK